MISVSDVLVVLYVDDKFPSSLSLNFTLTDVTHSSGIVVFQVTLTPGVEPPTLSALIATLPSEIEFRNNMLNTRSSTHLQLPLNRGYPFRILSRR